MLRDVGVELKYDFYHFLKAISYFFIAYLGLDSTWLIYKPSQLGPAHLQVIRLQTKLYCKFFVFDI
ncbi:hypothetical protein HanPSC8_Chr01g0002701 [Helianthus annuus]|nr:hypothetical protein HanPSC8_Chr01g0002701 [Helianthus annuus]